MAQRSVERTLPWAVVRWQRPSPGQGHHPIDGKKKGHIAGDVSLSVGRTYVRAMNGIIILLVAVANACMWREGLAPRKRSDVTCGHQ